jgi:hypothetical protein
MTGLLKIAAMYYLVLPSAIFVAHRDYNTVASIDRGQARQIPSRCWIRGPDCFSIPERVLWLPARPASGKCQPFAVGGEWPLSGTSKMQTQQARDWYLTNPEPHQ